ncbi:MAG: rod shape-determining protein MreB [Micromonosporaceae bacterium]
MRFRPGVAIDLGTVNTLVSVAGQGLVVEEPSAVALDRATGRVAAVGRPADALAGKEPVDVEVIYPLQDGVIADLEASTAMLQAFLRRASVRRRLLRPHAVVCVPTGATWVERRSIPAAIGSRSPRCVVTLVDEPVAAAAGAGVDLSGGEGAFIVDVGGGTTEVAVVAGGRVVRAESLRLGGNVMDDAIVSAVKADLGLLLGRKAARRLKMTLGLTGGDTGYAEVVGVDVAHRAPRVEYVPGELVAAALERTVATIVATVKEMQSDLPPDLAEDVVRGKIRLAGGGALLLGLANRIEASAGIPTVVVDDPLRCVVRGAAEILEHGGGIVAPGLPG